MSRSTPCMAQSGFLVKLHFLKQVLVANFHFYTFPGVQAQLLLKLKFMECLRVTKSYKTQIDVSHNKKR